MKLKLIPLLLGLGITTSLSAATERMCFGQLPIETTTDLAAKITIAENDFFANEKCNRFFSYYEKHVDFTQAECETNKDQLSLDKGYAPFGVFLRGTNSTGKDNIASYDWEIKNIATNEVLTTYNAFNASYVFDEPGEYSATLTITDKDGSTSTDTKNITVWARDGKDYFVDSAIGDDRYNGLSQTADNTCDANTAAIDSCSGPWKTATRALGEMSPYSVENYPNGEYTADEICLQKETTDITRYKQGNFKVFRSSTFLESDALKDNDGNFLPTTPTEICTQQVTKRKTILRPGDQVLFNRGQSFKLETAINTIRSYQAKNNGITYNYERLETLPLAQTGHWSKATGVHFGAYGSGQAPNIKNTGKSSTTAIHLKGVGMFNLSLSNLDFNLNSNTPSPFGTRASLAGILGKPINIVFKNISVKEMNQGIISSASIAQGLFIVDSIFYDSAATQIFTSNSYENVALINNSLDYSANHLIYSSISHGLIYNNTLSRPAFGRTAYRLSGGTFSKPNNYTWISENKISGWIDPRTSAEFGSAFNNGKRYNYALLNISPNSSKDKAIHDIVFTRNTISDAETFLNVGVGENIFIQHNTFQTADTSPAQRVSLNVNFSQRPLKNILIKNNKFIDTGIPTQTSSSSFIKLANYYQKKCTDQFNNEKINITNNTFYTLHDSKRILMFSSLKQGNNLLGTALPNLTLGQAEELLNKELTLSNNDFITPNSNSATLQIGGEKRANVNLEDTTIDWTQFYQGTDPVAGEFRLYNNLSQFNQQLGPISLLSTDAISLSALLATTYTAGGSTIEPTVELTWDVLIAYAKENNITPADLETMILNQVLAENPSYSGQSSEYSTEMTPLEKIGNWFTSIPTQIAQLFDSEEDKYDDAKNLATSNNISASEVMQDMKI